MPKKKKKINRLYRRIKSIKKRQKLRRLHRILNLRGGLSFFLHRKKQLKKRHKKKKQSLRRPTTQVKSIAKYFLSRAVAKRERIRKKKGLIYLRLVMTQTILTMTHFRLIHTIRRKRHRYKNKIRRIRAKKKRRSRKIKGLFRKILYYPDRIKQPKWIHRKIRFSNAIAKNSLKPFRIYIKALNKKSTNRTNKIMIKRKTFNYNNHICKFNIKKKVKIYRRNNLRKTSINYPNYVKLAKNLMWKLLLRFRYLNKRLRKKIKRVRFKKRMLLKAKRHYKYRKRNLYKNNRKTVKLKKNKHKKSAQILFVLNTIKSNRKIKVNKMICYLRTLEYRLYGLKRKLKRMLHFFKKALISKNDIIKRIHAKTRGKKNRKMFYINTLPIYKTDIKNSYCLRLLYNPELMKRLILTLN